MVYSRLLCEWCFRWITPWGWCLDPPIFTFDFFAFGGYWVALTLPSRASFNLLLATQFAVAMLDHIHWIIYTFKLTPLIQSHHSILRQVIAHLVKLRVYFVVMFQVQDNLLWLGLKVILKLLVTNLASSQELSHILLQFYQSVSKLSERIGSQSFFAANESSIEALNVCGTFDKDVKWKVNWLFNGFSCWFLCNSALTRFVGVKLLLGIECEGGWIDGLLWVANLVTATHIVVNLAVFVSHADWLMLVHKLNYFLDWLLWLVK